MAVRGTYGNEALIMQGGRSLEAWMRGGRGFVVATRGPESWTWARAQRLRVRPQGERNCLGAERVRSCENRRSGRSDRGVGDGQRAIRTNGSNEACRWCLGDRSGACAGAGVLVGQSKR